MERQDDILQIIVNKNIEYENRVEDITMGKKLKAVFEANLFKSGKLEISNIQLSEITGKEIRGINRDMKLEFGTILKRFMHNRDTGGDHDSNTMNFGLNMLREGIRYEEEPDERGRRRPVYYFSGLALTQLLSRWDPVIRFLINVTIHRLMDKLNNEGYYPTSMSDMEEDLFMVMNLTNDLESAYYGLANETNLEHIKENYKTTIAKIEEKRNEIIALQKRKKEVYPTLTRIIDEIREIDKNCADILTKNAKMKEYENEKEAKIAFERE